MGAVHDPDLVELMRMTFAAANRGDFAVYSSPDIVLDTAGYGMGTFDGREAAITNYVRVRSASVSVWEDGAIVRNTIYPETDIDEARAAAERLAEEQG
jgi:hypothetical protein